MAVGDEVNLNEDLYHQLIGRYVATIEVLVRRNNLKDQKIAILETQQAKFEAAHQGAGCGVDAVVSEPKEGDIAFGDAEGNPPTD